MVSIFKSFAAALVFYTSLPIPLPWNLDVRYVARLAPLIGLVIGGLLTFEDWILRDLTMPLLTRTTVLVASGLALTGGLHMDGVMDTADGLAVMDPKRRLDVMADSNTGAFGAMTAVVLLGLKVMALADLAGTNVLTGDNTLGANVVDANVSGSALWPVLLTVPMWGRWGQQVAIVAYPYLKPTGKGAFHKDALDSAGVIISGLVCCLITIGCWALIYGSPLAWGGQWWAGQWWAIIGIRLLMAVGAAIATGAWFNAKLGGHTGDTYGAVVEWTEAITLTLFTLLA
ncbi:MAG: adenosylcobinamide-GDP ribazoletransferase [Cyanobacteria bacterium P01_F01_bin.150]